MTRTTLRLSVLALAAGMALAAQAEGTLRGQSDALARLNAATGATAQVSYNAATGAARFVRVGGNEGASASKSTLKSRAAMTDAARGTNAAQFLKSYGDLFGITDTATELAAPRITKDQHGGSHVSYKQLYRGVPVFGGELKVHYDAADNLTVANGVFIPGIAVNATPSRTAAEAAKIATKRVMGDLGRSVNVSTKSTLMVYREGLAQGVAGANHLAWEVVVGNGTDVRNFVYVDAHTGQVIDSISGIHDAKNRRAYNGNNVAQPGPNYPNNPFWVEGQPFPTGTAEADNMIAASSDIYDLFKAAFGRDSYDGNGATMHSIFNRGNDCPNASWGGAYISFCPGTTTDDVTAHEWGHAYTEYTHGLVYHWQPGALNEAYSDIWGETVDRINGRGGDTPDAARTDGSCTVFSSAPPTITVSAPASLAGNKDAGTAAWGPTVFQLNGTVQGVEIGSTSAACAALPAGSLTGKIAFIERGTCGFSQKALNAENAGAIGVIIGNNQGGTAIQNMSVTAGFAATQPALSVSQNDGTAFKAALAAGAVTVTLKRGPGSDNSIRWLMGEDSTAFNGAIRDMYMPTCYNNPGKVSDRQYQCGPDTQAGDWGGVHTNSGVPNHGYALLVDGGNYNGQSISGIGITKAAHLYYRAQTVYQHSVSGFADHADALEQSCRDLTGINLNDLKTGAPSGQIISAADCSQITKMAAAVELRATPSQCSFAPLLAQSPPALCPSGTATSLISDSFDGGRRAGLKWVASYAGVNPEFTPRNWGVVSSLPSGRSGYGMFAADASIGNCQPGSDQSGVQRLESPEFTIPAGETAPRMTFDHWIATEGTYDGGNVKISVNGGAYQLIKAADFIYNPYNLTLATAAGGNTNPLAGQAAFSGTDAGGFTGTWGRSIINLAPYAKPNDKVKIRFDMGQDGCGGAFGWYLDDVMVYRCTP